jgi:hypothetical protein
MKKLIIPLTLLALGVNAQVQDNYFWEGAYYKAQSTWHIDKTIVPLGMGEIQFNLINNGCLWGGGGGGHIDDCDPATDSTSPGEVFRSQLVSKTAYTFNKPWRYTFSFKDISEDDGLGYGGPGITMFELYPAWSHSRAGKPPVFHIWYNPLTKGIEIDINNDWKGKISIANSEWNEFVIETIQSEKSNGYMKIYHNGLMIYDYKGTTSYRAVQGTNFWIGAYACCSFTPSGEPDHNFIFKNVTVGGI